MNTHFWYLAASFVCLVLVAFAIGFAALKKSNNKRLYVPILLLLVLLPLWAYHSMGNWAALQTYAEAQSRQARARALLAQIHSPQQLADKLKAQLKKDPNSARGWYLLGRIYASVPDWSEAEASFKKAYQLNNQDETIVLSYAESLWQLNHQKCDDHIRGLYQLVLKNNPKQPDALTMLALDAYRSQEYSKAIVYWKQLLSLVPAQSEEARMIQRAITKAEKKAQ